jgi:pimeloyl-ACP methyl ester carboxylesterase
VSDPHSIRVNDVNLSYCEWPGEKGPLLCLPGLVGHKGAFDEVAARLSPDYHLLALDLRGRGDSDKPAEGYGFAYHARDLLAFADALGLDHFAVVGHSFGATVAIYLASIRPERVRCLALIDGGADPKEEVLQAMRPTIARLDDVYPSVDAYLEAMRQLPYYQPWNSALERYFRQDVESLADGAVRAKARRAAVERDLDVHFYYSMCLHFPALQCPTLFIRPRNGLLGNRGHILDEREAAAFVGSIPHCWRVDLPHVNHYTMLLAAEPAVAPVVKAFMEFTYE